MYGSNFVRVVRGDTHRVGDLTVTGTDQPIGEWYDLEPSDTTRARLANGRALGFLSMNVTTSGMSLEKLIMEYEPKTAESGQKVTLEQVPVGGEIEVEAPTGQAYNATSTSSAPVLMVTTGTGALSASTTIGTKVSFKNGRLYEAQSGDMEEFEVLDAAVTPITSGNIRIRFRRIATGPNKA